MEDGSAHHKNRGFSLTEVMLACFIMTTGMLAMVRMQSAALIQVHHNQQMLQADWLVQDLIARIRVNPEGFRQLPVTAIPLLQNLDDSSAHSHCHLPVRCPAAQFAAGDVSRWSARVHETLPGATVSVASHEHGLETSVRLWQLELSWRGAPGHADASLSSGRFVL